MSDLVSTGRLSAWRAVRPGDPWTFIFDESIRSGIGDCGEPAKVGDVIAWLPDDAPPEVELIFEVVRIWPPFTYECVSVAQPPAFRHRSHLALDREGAAP